jgi:hypothetical protein
MTWKIVRLELAESVEYPRGSASRAYILRVPLDDQGRIDQAELEQSPGDATVRRYWPSEPDTHGFLVPQVGAWAISLDGHDAAGSHVGFHFSIDTLEVEGRIIVTQPDGRSLLLRVAKIAELAEA